tara:strand:- start:1783 stop:3648 length:1866 start_codon:yes stop_codon:yes gene_type:complete
LKKGNYILGLSCYYHDSAVCLLKDGHIVSAVQEERFSRKKHDSRFPINSVKYILNNESIDLRDIKSIAYYEKPLLTFERLLETYISVAPRGFVSFIAAMQVWIKEKLFLKNGLKKEFKKIQSELVPEEKNIFLPELIFTEHHQAHAAAAFYPSPFSESAILCMDGVGEWVTTSAWIGASNKIKPIWEINFPHSLGLLYSSFTYFCGFKVNSGEYKLMGLAPYGSPIYYEKIKKYLVDIKEDGSFRLNLKYFKYHRGLRMTSSSFNKLFGSKPREKESAITQFHMDLAASIQKVTEEIVVKLARSLRDETGIKNICLAGGVALNCVANGKLLKEQIFENIWIQPASGDAGSSLGSSLIVWHERFGNVRIPKGYDSMRGSYLGPYYSNEEIIKFLKKNNFPYISVSDEFLFNKISKEISQGKVIGWFNGPMEFGPRALGARSIIGDPRDKKMQRIMNLKIKFRESFRPFAPSILEEDLSEIFEIDEKSPYMLIVAPVRKELRFELSEINNSSLGIEKINEVRSSIPAVTHVDYSARIQTVNKLTNPRYYKLIKAFKKETGIPLLINTSFNVRGEPIVCSPEDAYKCFMRTEMDILVLENQILFKEEQSNFEDNLKWQEEFELD